MRYGSGPFGQIFGTTAIIITRQHRSSEVCRKAYISVDARQTFREVAGKHAIEQPQQALLHKITSIFDHVCKDAIYARTFATFQALDALTQLINSNVCIEACII